MKSWLLLMAWQQIKYKRRELRLSRRTQHPRGSRGE